MGDNKKIITPLSIFFNFAAVGLRGFGGVMPYVYEELVERKKWLKDDEFTELIAIGQILPGANVTNFAAMFGYRVAGLAGAGSAVLGLLVPPFILLLIIYHYFKMYSDLDVVQGILKGILSVSTALVFVTAYKMMRSQTYKLQTVIVSAVCVLLATVLKIPLLQILILLCPISIYFSWKKIS